MKRYKKMLSMALIAAMLLGTTACAGTQTEITTAATQATTDDKELDNEAKWDEVAQIDEVKAENENGTGSLYKSGEKAGNVKALCYYDLADTEPQLAKLLAERFGGTIETQVCQSGSAYFEQLALLIQADDSPDIVRYDWMAYPWGVSKNMFTALDDWLDIESPLWSQEKSIIDNFTYAGKHYYFPSAMQTNFAIIYNKLCLEEAGLPDPQELYFEGNWTWDTFEDMCSKWAYLGDEYVGFTGGSWSSMMFANTTGTKIIDMTGTEIVNNMKNQNVQRTMDWLSDMKKIGYIGDGFVAPGDAFLDGTLLFLGMGFTWGFEGSQETLFKNNVACEMEAVPFPRDPQSDKYYMSSDTFGYMVPAGAKNMQGAIDWILCGRIYETDEEIIAADRAEKLSTDPVYFAKCPECKYNFTENGDDKLTVCPECGAARKQKFKAVYSENMMKIVDDMTNPEKFSFVFDNSVGFSNDLAEIFINGEDSVYDGPIYYGGSYTQLRDTNYGVVETYLDPYRDALAKAVASA